MSAAETPQATGTEPAPAVPPAAGQTILATGRRKQSVARVRLRAGNGAIVVNRKPYDAYFVRETLRLAVREPLVVTRQMGRVDVVANVEGGGSVGQAGAIRLGLARALLQLDEANRLTLRGAGMLTRDPRERERKKYGRKGARKQFQWTKR